MRWILDHKLSSLTFRIKHLLGVVKGEFNSFSIENIEFQNQVLKRFDLFILSESICTRQLMRDQHLRSPDFFDSAVFPFLRFLSSRIETENTNKLIIYGNLRIKALEIPITLQGKFIKTTQLSKDSNTQHYKITTFMSRNMAGLNWNGATNEGIVILGDRIDIAGDIYLTQTNDLKPL